MIKGTTPPFEIPNEMRAVTERSVEQAKLAFNNYMQAAQEAVSTFEEWVKASQVGAQGIGEKAMSFAERNVLSAFEFAQKIVQAKDIQELVRMQTEFIQSQMQVLNEQVKDLGETATKTAMESVKTANRDDLSEIGKIKGELRKSWQNDPIVPLCIRIVEFVCSVPEHQLGRLTFASFLEPLHKNRIDDELMRALTILVSSRVAALDARALLVNDDQSQYELSVEELAEARAAGQLVHPQTGELVPEFEARVIPFFVPSARLRGVRSRGVQLRRARVQ